MPFDTSQDVTFGFDGKLINVRRPPENFKPIVSAEYVGVVDNEELQD